MPCGTQLEQFPGRKRHPVHVKSVCTVAASCRETPRARDKMLVALGDLIRSITNAFV
jgi:hypothetical protein